MTIQKFSSDELLDLPLRDWGAGQGAGSLPLSLITGRKIRVPGCEASNYGIWEAAPGSFVRKVETAEYMHILSGVAIFAPQDGEAIPIKAGDSLFFPPQTQGVWHIQTPLRKIYLMLTA